MNLKEIDMTDEITIRDNLKIDENDNIDYYNEFYLKGDNSLLAYGKSETIGDYYLEVKNDDFQKISFSLKKDDSIKFFEYMKQDDYFSSYCYSANKNRRILYTAQTVLDNHYDAKYKMAILEPDNGTDYPVGGYEITASENVIINHIRDIFRQNLPVLNTIISQIEITEHCDITDLVFNSNAARTLEYSKVKKR